MTGEQITQAQELAAELFKRIEAAKSELLPTFSVT